MKRHPQNPIITPADIVPSSPELKVIGTFNPGAVIHDGRVHLLIRVAETAICEKDEVATLQWLPTSEGGKLECRRYSKSDRTLDLSDSRYIRREGKTYLSSISHLRLATSEDGVNFAIGDKPFLGSSDETEAYGVEDARITKLDDRYYINYSAVSRDSWYTNMMSTTDFHLLEHHGIIFPPQNKDVSLFPRKIGGKFAALHRPHNFDFGSPSIWYAESPDLIHWGKHRCILRPEGRYEGQRIGGGPPCIETPEGWLHIYHAADENNIYRIFTVLLDLESPWKVIQKSSRPLLEPEAKYETHGFFPGVVFCNGMVSLPDGRILLYYGAADETIALCETSIAELLRSLD
ncbi:MAG: glycoside hydrolase family 130 protein [Chthoniobacterales bacterium]